MAAEVEHSEIANSCRARMGALDGRGGEAGAQAIDSL
jgi:hypothetical protein